jgi:G3E family GTPase
LERKLVTEESDKRDISNLLIDQIEFSNVIVLNKMDMITEEDATRLENIMLRLNPSAKLVRSSFSAIDLNCILNTGLFDFNKAVRAPGWIKELQEQHSPETLEYGINSFVYRRKSPFHPQKLHQMLLNSTLQGVVRSKGFFLVSGDSRTIFMWSSAGASFRFNPASVSYQLAY